MMLLGYQPPRWALLPSWDRGTPSRSVAVSQDGATRNGLNAGAFGSQFRNGAADCSGIQPSSLLGCGCCCHPRSDHVHAARDSEPRVGHKRATSKQKGPGPWAGTAAREAERSQAREAGMKSGMWCGRWPDRDAKGAASFVRA